MNKPNSDPLELGRRAWPLFSVSLVVGVIGLAVAIFLGWSRQDAFRRFYFAYMTNWSFFFTIVLGAIFFVLCQHACRAGWSVNVRRVAELIGATMPIMAVLAAPIVVSILMNNGTLYPWAQKLPPIIEKPIIALPADASSPTHQKQQITEEDHLQAEEKAEGPAFGHDRTQEPLEKLAELSSSKRFWLSPGFFIARMVFYLVAFSVIGFWAWRRSVGQDDTGDPETTKSLQGRSTWLLVVVALLETLAAWDWLQGLDPTWYSTIFGFYIFAGCAIAIMATLIVVTALLQGSGMLRAINKEHYHDLGKLMFAFVFFWGYIAYSQYMLYWYANIPEETAWWHRRGASTMVGNANGWSVVLLVILFGMFVLPFAGLLSRHVKRTRWSVIFWAVVLLVAHWIEIWWIVMPEFDGRVTFGLIDVAAFVGIGGILTAAAVRLASRHALRPLRDPRVGESMAFENM